MLQKWCGVSESRGWTKKDTSCSGEKMKKIIKIYRRNKGKLPHSVIAERVGCTREYVSIVLKKNDVEEYDIYTATEMETFGGYIIKVRVNMVVPAVATDYDEALSEAETYVDNITFPECVHGISIGTWDSALKEEKGFLMRCKGA